MPPEKRSEKDHLFHISFQLENTQNLINIPLVKKGQFHWINYHNSTGKKNWSYSAKGLVRFNLSRSKSLFFSAITQFLPVTALRLPHQDWPVSLATQKGPLKNWIVFIIQPSKHPNRRHWSREITKQSSRKGFVIAEHWSSSHSQQVRYCNLLVPLNLYIIIRGIVLEWWTMNLLKLVVGQLHRWRTNDY